MSCGRLSPLHLNYFAGLGLALLLNKDCVRGKAIWRAFPVLAYAIPGFITLLAFKFMFSYGGPVNQIIVAHGGGAVGFLDLDAKWTGAPDRTSGQLLDQYTADHAARHRNPVKPGCFLI